MTDLCFLWVAEEDNKLAMSSSWSRTEHPASMHRTASNLKKDVSIWIIILKATSMSSMNLPHTSHCPVQVVQGRKCTWSASKVLLWSSTILIHYIAAGIMKVMKVTLCLQLVAAHWCTSITLTNDKLHLIQTTISHILRASGQSLHSYNNDDYHNGPYDPYPFHVPTK